MDRDEAFNTIGIKLRAENLPPLPTATANRIGYNPFVVISASFRNAMINVGRTEASQTQNPTWDGLFRMQYKFEEKQTLCFKVFYKSPGNEISQPDNHIPIGEAIVTLRHLIDRRDAVEVLARGNLRAGSTGPPRLLVHAENVMNMFQCSLICDFMVTGVSADSSARLGIQRCQGDGHWTTALETSAKDGFAWPRCYATLSALCDGDLLTPVKFVLQQDSKIVGETRQISVSDILHRKGKEDPTFELHVVSDSHCAVIGELVVHNGLIAVTVEEGYEELTLPSIVSHEDVKLVEPVTPPPSTFANFIAGGCEIGMMVAIDFTKSNDGKTINTSLHRLTPESHQLALLAAQTLTPQRSPLDAAAALDAATDTNNESADQSAVENPESVLTDEVVLYGLNEYQKVILSVGSIIVDYDTDNVFPVMGFGAKVPQQGTRDYKLSHCFPLDPERPDVIGLAGIMEAYGASVQVIEKSGPTFFAPCIRKCHDFALAHPCSQAHQVYHVLVIITDGDVNDMDDTIDAIVALAHLPVSLIIVGIGNCEFADMHKLDGDTVPLVSRAGETVCRDIVQFVPFNRFESDVDALRREVLAEIPFQVLDYMHQHNIRPNPPRSLESNGSHDNNSSSSSAF